MDALPYFNDFLENLTLYLKFEIVVRLKKIKSAIEYENILKRI